MLTDLKTYTKYKESALPWLRQVPAHWELVPNRGLVRKRKVLVGKRHNEFQLLSLTKQGVIIRDISTGKGKFSSDMGTSQEVRSGDLVFCFFDVPETPRTVGLSKHDGMITGAYTVFEPLARCLPDYFELFYIAMDDRKLLSPLYSGLRNTIPTDRFLGTKTPQPPPEEQEAIGRFLNYTNGRLDRAIRAKRKVIALLNEKKQAIIHRAVTHGFDPNVKLKPSSIPWLGDIPQHWEVRRLKSFVSNIAEQTTSMRDNDVYIALENVRSWTGLVEPQSQSGSPLFIGQVKRFQPNDVLFGKLRPYLAKAFTAMMAGVCVGEFFVLRVKSDLVLPQFLENLLRTKPVIDLINSSTFGAKMPRADWQFVGSLRFALPPVDVQQAIIEHIVQRSHPLTTAISRLEREIELLREYRTRLVADVMTGKLDVREVANKLPDETEVEIAEPVEDLDKEVEMADEEATA